VKKAPLFQIAGGAILAGGGLFVFFRDVDTHELVRNLRATPIWVIVGIVLLTFLTLWLRSIRWRIILPASPDAHRRDLFGLVMIGFLVNNFLPARLGEAARMFLLWKRNRFTAAESIGSVMLERFLDTMVFSTFLFIPVFCLPELRVAMPLACLAAGGFAVTVLGFALYALFPSATKRRARNLLALAPARAQTRVASFGAELISNLDWLFSFKKSFVVIAFSFLMVFCHPLMMIILVRRESFRALGGMFAASTAALGAAIPLSPGYVGTLHAALKQGLIMLGVDSQTAIATAVLYHAAGYVTVTILGLFYFFKLKISFKDIRGAKKAIAEKEKGEG
jgi:glycosyltransferase 2 family protein